MWTDRQRQTYHRQYDRWLTQQDRKAVRIVLARFGIIYTRIRETLTRTNPEGLRDALSFVIKDSDFQAILERIYTTTGVDAAEREYNRLVPPVKGSSFAMLTKDRDSPNVPQLPQGNNGPIRLSHNSEVWRQRMVQLARSSETAARITKLASKTRDLVRDVLTESASSGWNIRKLASKLRDVVVDKARATLIARTETTRASSVGHEIGAQSTFLVLNKVWISTLDGRTRMTHIIAGQQKPINRDAYFTVGGKPMKYPGDPAGGAEECANCRCTVAYVPATNFFN